MRIRNKLESVAQIKKLNLNRFPEELFTANEVDRIENFMNKYPAKHYAVRSKEVVGCKQNNFKVLADDVIEYSKKFNLFSINISSYNYSDNQVLIGDAMIDSESNIWIIASKNKDYTGKMAEQNPDYNFSSTIYNKKVKNIPGIDIFIDYVYNHNLLNTIIEFAIYDTEVGINSEKIIVFEIRTDY